MASFTIEPDLRDTLLEMSEEELMAFVKLQEDPFSEAPIELRIMIHVMLYDKKRRIEYLEHARHLSKVLLADTAADDPKRTQREDD